MVTGISEEVTIQEYHPQIDKDPGETVSNINSDDSGNPIVVSKDFILGLLSLAVGNPFALEGNLGKKIDVKV